MTYANELNPKDVMNGKSFCQYCQQELGMPMPFVAYEIVTLENGVKEFFNENPAASWESLCKVVQWAKGKSWRYATAYNLLKKGLPKAYAEGWLPELEPGARPEDIDIDNKIYAALRVETDDLWRQKLMSAVGKLRHEVLQSWLQEKPELNHLYEMELKNG